MKAVSEFVANLNDVFLLFGEIEAKRMFGGYGIYRDGLMFALVADDVLYLKADPESVSFLLSFVCPSSYMRSVARRWECPTMPRRR